MPASRALLLPAALCLALGSSSAAGAQDEPGHSERARRRVQGRVLDSSGWPLAGARVYALERAEGASKGVSHPLLETTSDEDGRFSFDALEPGTYQIDIEAPDHQAAHVGVHLPDAPVPVAPIEVNLWPVTTRAVHAPDPPSGPGATPSVAPVAPPFPGAPAPQPVPATAPFQPAAAPSGLAIEVTGALEAGQVQHARSLLEEVDGVQREDADLFYAVGEALVRYGEPAEAVAVLDQALARDPGHVEARYRRALALLALGRRDDARVEFQRVLDQAETGPLADRARTALAALAELGPGSETP
jgi:hypothetical protein